MAIPDVLHLSTCTATILHNSSFVTHPNTCHPSSSSTGDEHTAGTEEHRTVPAHDLTFLTNGTDYTQALHMTV